MTDRYAESDTWPNPPASQQPARPATLAASEASRVAAFAEAMGLAPRYASSRAKAARVVAVADAEQAELRAEVGRLRGLIRVSHEDVRAVEYLDRAEAAEAESARLASVVAKVEALADKWKNTPGAFVQHGSVLSSAWREASLSLDAALASVGVSGSADDRREANGTNMPDQTNPYRAAALREGRADG